MDWSEAESVIGSILADDYAREAFDCFFAKLRTDNLMSINSGKPPSGDVMAEGVEMTKFKACQHAIVKVQTALVNLYPKEE